MAFLQGSSHSQGSAHEHPTSRFSASERRLAFSFSSGQRPREQCTIQDGCAFVNIAGDNCADPGGDRPKSGPDGTDSPILTESGSGDALGRCLRKRSWVRRERECRVASQPPSLADDVTRPRLSSPKSASRTAEEPEITLRTHVSTGAAMLHPNAKSRIATDAGAGRWHHVWASRLPYDVCRHQACPHPP
ncbi:hypothetical protein MPH_08920 [Macrophomina phaseolina MS6]|uniref:Uncharacterized protein n=1 Tax=Macrophomina phaseolina (strain MS6) TaxID=1126212 RepID=K2QVZ9_MACPH|nr:hypothetical protein MPH_08920 [Macrophomina phaseolina MS6]